MENKKPGVIQESLDSQTRPANKSKLGSAVQLFASATQSVASLVLGKPGLVKHVSPDRPAQDHDEWSYRADRLPPTQF
jgi:hypothetical protein